MPFPFSHSGEIAFAKAGSHRHFANAFLDRLERELTRKKATRIVRKESELSFSAGMLRPVASSNPLTTISGGRVEVVGERDAERVRYRLRFGQWFVASIVFLALLAPNLWSEPRIQPAQRLEILAGFWLLVFGGGFAFSAASFRSMLQSAGRYRYAEADSLDR